MHESIVVKQENVRGCGKRKPGGLYLVSDDVSGGCGKLPIPFEICPCCGEGIRPSRAPRWIDQPERLWQDLACNRSGGCDTCPLQTGYETGPALLIWVGEKFYPTPDKFVQESALQGVSRRIKSIPTGFEVGQTWVMLAHRKAIDLVKHALFDPDQPIFQPGIFSIFRPTRIEVIVTGKESEKTINEYLKRGLTPVFPVYPGRSQPSAAADLPDQPSLI